MMFKSESIGNTGKICRVMGINAEEAAKLMSGGEFPQPIGLTISQVIDRYVRKGGFVANVVLTEALKAVDFLMPVDLYYKDFGMCLFTAEEMSIDGLGSLKLEFTLNPARLRSEFISILNTLSAQSVITGIKSKTSLKEEGTIKMSFYADGEDFYDTALKWYEEN
ncbi:MAG: hypothetical protein LUD72_13890 [Bacteroidales bacterium]|nr:hypothetical protein [Bacteroidales bacterium]